MSIATEISRIQADKATIRSKLIELGMATSTDNLDKLAQAIEGLVNRGAVKIEVREGETYTIPAGYHNGSGTIAAVSGGGNYTLQAKTATPTKQQQSIVTDEGYYGLSSVTVAPIPDVYQDVSAVTAVAGEVLVGKIIVTKNGETVAGTMTNNGGVEKILDATTITFTIPKGYHDGTGKVEIVLEEKNVTPTKSKQTITPTAGKVLSKVTVEAIPNKYQDVTPVTATGDKVLVGSDIVDASGNVVEGSMPNKGAVTLTIDGLTSTNTSIPIGYHNGNGNVSLTSDIEEALAAI
jgi:hypothetical protein